MIESTLMRAWHQRGGLAIALLPVAAMFGLIAAVRRGLFRVGALRSVRLPVPVIIVGNITVGGSGKTPLSIYLVEQLRQAGYHPGVVSRGYGRHSADLVEVQSNSTPAQAGDEPLLIASRTGAPVMVGSDRVAAAQALLKNHPEIDLILSDDGLQHYRLQRNFEIAVLDSRGLMNGWFLPAGPLREPASRLASVDAVVRNGGRHSSTPQGSAGAVSPAPTSAVNSFGTTRVPEFVMTLKPGKLYRLDDNTRKMMPGQLAPGPVHALAGIGHPQRFFDQLAGMGLDVVAHPFPDHHDYVASDIPDDGRPILITEKDAVKLDELAKSGALGTREIWVLPVNAGLQSEISNETLITFILEKIRGPSPA